MRWDHDRPWAWDSLTASSWKDSSQGSGGQAVGNCRLMILLSPKWRPCTCFSQRAMWNAPSEVNDTLHYKSYPLFRLFKQCDVIKLQFLWRMVLCHISPVAWNNCSAAILVTKELSAGNFLQLGLLDPPTWILAIFSFGDTSSLWSTMIPSYLSPTLKKERLVHNILQFMLLSTVEYAILLSQMEADNDGHHIEHGS